MDIRFGPAGLGSSFSRLGYKKTIQVGDYLEKFGLNHFEYQCGHGVRLSEKNAVEIGNSLATKGISISIHAPYYISLSSPESEKRMASVRYILQSARLAKAMGGTRIVVHSGSCGKMPRKEALELSKKTLESARAALVENGLEEIICCPETMGKINQLGTLSEVLELCKVDESFIPCIDFGHLNARTAGELKIKFDYDNVFKLIEKELGKERLKNLHFHFSKIEYTKTGGEKKHLTFEDETYGPDFEPLLELVQQRNLSPIIICESSGTQTEDAATMMRYYAGLVSE